MNCCCVSGDPYSRFEKEIRTKERLDEIQTEAEDEVSSALRDLDRNRDKKLALLSFADRMQEVANEIINRIGE
jgi:hypothetical protein